MRPEHFQTQINRLIGTFGKNAYGPERAEIIWRTVKHLDDAWLTRTIDRFVGDLRYAPLLPDFREEIAKERERSGAKGQAASEPAWSASPRCDFCKDTGAYVCISNQHPGIWAFRCHCEKGESDPRVGMPQFKQDHAAEFTYRDTPRAKERAS